MCFTVYLNFTRVSDQKKCTDEIIQWVPLENPLGDRVFVFNDVYCVT